MILFYYIFIQLQYLFNVICFYVINQGYIKLIKSDSKNIYNVTKKICFK